MHHRHLARVFAVVVVGLVVFQWALTAQTPAGQKPAAQKPAAQKPAAQAPAAQTPTEKRPLSYDVVDYWRTIQGTRLSNDGQWLAYATSSQAEDGELVVRNVKTGQEFKHPRGTGPMFSSDNAFLVFTIAQSKADAEKESQATSGSETPAAGQGARGEGAAATTTPREPRTGLAIMALPGGKVTTVEKVGSFRMAAESATWLVYYKGVGGGGAAGGARGAGGGGRGAGGAAPAAGARGATTPAAGQAAQRGGRGATREKRKDPGSDLILRKLATGEETTIPEVTEYSVDPKGTWLTYATSSADAAKDGAFARLLADGSVKTLMTGRGHYKSLTFNEAGNQIAFLSDQAEYDKPVSPYRLYLWKGGDAPAVELVSATTPGVLKGLVVADSAPRFSRDGSMISLNVGPPPAPNPAPTPDPNDKTPAPLTVDLWSYKDQVIQPMQKVQADAERSRTYRGVVHLADGRYVQLATPDLPTVNPGDDPARAIGTSSLPYRMEVSWDQSYNDVYLVDLRTGKPTRILEHWGSGANTLSPGGKYVLYFNEQTGHWFTYRIADGARVNLTEKLPVRFQQDFTTPDLPGPYGTGGWTADDQSLLIYDEFDIWEIKPDGTGARMITNGDGRKQSLIFRYRSLDPEERTVPTTKPMLLTTTHERTRATGFYRTAFNTTAAPEKLVMQDKAFGALTKAAKADTLVFTLSRFEEFPDLWLAGDLTFKDMRKVSNANPQQAQYVWGKSEMIEYINGDGKKLRALLTKPDNFDPSKKYPMMVYIYEELTAGLHSYGAPGVGTSIIPVRYVSAGYVLLRPDIVYETGFPGESAEKCVIPAVNTVVAMGFIDPKRIGIQGHSWGAYQITHMISRTDLFAAVEAGASVSNMISAYGGIRWGTGMVRQFQYEKTQSRIGAPPWDAPLLYIENSPIFWVKNIHTPYLTIHNDGDDAVPWYQGIEFNMAMRRLGKEAYMFNYNGEPHGLRNRDNMKNWTVHMDEFFDHYLLGKPRPEWMDKGVSYLDRGKRDVSRMFKKK
jgi:dipeptidyl aminopeptidase/acylaminoacyl peptidase